MNIGTVVLHNGRKATIVWIGSTTYRLAYQYGERPHGWWDVCVPHKDVEVYPVPATVLGGKWKPTTVVGVTAEKLLAAAHMAEQTLSRYSHNTLTRAERETLAALREAIAEAEK